MRDFTRTRGAHTPDQLWMVEHPAVYTQGLAGRLEHVGDLQEVPLVPSDRGGQITYHGPGQAIAYPLMDLKRRQWTLKHLLHALEQSVIDLLAHYAIRAQRRVGAPGVYVDQAKMAFIGLRIHRHCSYHGISLNIDMDLAPFARIQPCGIPGLKITQLRDLGCQASQAEIVSQWVYYLSSYLDNTSDLRGIIS